MNICHNILQLFRSIMEIIDYREKIIRNIQEVNLSVEIFFANGYLNTTILPPNELKKKFRRHFSNRSKVHVQLQLQ